MPSVPALLMPVLRTLADGAEHPSEAIRKRVAEELSFPDGYLNAINPRTGQSPFENHIAWALAYLNIGNAVIKQRRGVYQITERGQSFLARGIGDLTIKEAKNG